MAKITVTAKANAGVHLKYGEIKAGQTYTIDEEDFGEQLFHRPPGFESPHERADRERHESETGDQVPGTGESLDLSPIPDPPSPISAPASPTEEEVN